MKITLNRESKVPIYLQIKKQIADKISSGELPPNYILPPERILSSTLSVNRSTVIKAYMELKADGLVESKVGSGTVVLTPLSKQESESMYIPPLRWNQLESRAFGRNNDDSINSILSVFGKGKIISFASGISPKDSHDPDIIRKLQMILMDKYKEEIFMPTPVDGSVTLKNTIKQLLKLKGITAVNKQIMVTSGSQQAIEFFAKLLIEPGDFVIVEEPTFIGAIQAFEAYGAKIIGVPMNHDGMKLDILESYIIKYRPKFIYVQPNYQNPTGITMSLEKRKELLRLAYYYNIPIFEDDPYGDLNYEGSQLPSLKSLDNNDYVVYISSFSKIISFSLRVGYVVASENIINRFISFKQITDIQTGTFNQLFVNEFITEGYLDKHIEKEKAKYKRKRDMMIKALQNSKMPKLQFIIPAGGFFIWCRLPENIRLHELMSELNGKGVSIMPGDIFFPHSNSEDSYIRLNFSYPTEEDILEGMTILLNVIRNSTGIIAERKYQKIAEINPYI